MFYWLCEKIICLFFLLVYKHRVYFPEGKYAYKKGAILASNHASFYDPPLIAISWREPVSFLARKTLFRNFLFRIIITRLNAHPIGQNELSSLKLACTLLEEGKKIVIFPEGTRSKDGHIGHFKKGVAMLAERAECAIIPIYIHGAFEAWPYKSKFPCFFRKKTACVIGKPLFIEAKGILDKKGSQQHLVDALHKEILHLKEWYLKKNTTPSF